MINAHEYKHLPNKRKEKETIHLEKGHAHNKNYKHWETSISSPGSLVRHDALNSRSREGFCAPTRANGLVCARLFRVRRIVPMGMLVHFDDHEAVNASMTRNVMRAFPMPRCPNWLASRRRSTVPSGERWNKNGSLEKPLLNAKVSGASTTGKRLDGIGRPMSGL
ncbi:hypothetical protein BCR44DRAFT_1487644 [Catenaria anguillulae PL171]|uniref:Uncharacterized protein n=1 Tax=Catenaria anguillulae PL171 TaxID=765915 RepID=A0A1Y2HAU6_9FUNG|nr:hypothetical protein BCR44DRAFT_1487644 [Catenaria anguillulae PL171]